MRLSAFLIHDDRHFQIHERNKYENILPPGTVHFVLARPPLENGEPLEKANVEAPEKAAGNQENLATLDQDKALSSKDQEMDAKRQRLKNKEEASTTSMDTTENNLEDNGTAPIRADVDLAEDKPPTAQTMACNQGLLDPSKEFTRSPHPILKAQTEPEFEGELLLYIFRFKRPSIFCDNIELSTFFQLVLFKNRKVKELSSEYSLYQFAVLRAFAAVVICCCHLETHCRLILLPYGNLC